MKKLIAALSLFNLLYAKVTDNTLRVSFQNLKFQNEHMGLLETSYLFNFSHFYTGLSIYSAVTGKRGGFFTGGFTAGYKLNISKTVWDSGIFIGGGGGGHAPQGSGLMTKIYTGVLIPYKNHDYGLNVSHIKFKDGSINSTQIGFVYDYNYKDVYLNSYKTVFGNFDEIRYVFTPFINRYFVFSSQTTTHKKQDDFYTVGAEIKKYSDRYFTFIEAAGAFSGKSDGYAEFMGGIGENFKYITLKLSAGAAGGGEVDTKGGFVYKIEAEKNIGMIDFSAGFFNAPGGVKAYTLKAGISRRFSLITYGNKQIFYTPKKFSISVYSESYLPSDTIRKDSDSKKLDVMNVDIGIYQNKNIEYLINAGSAYNGGSGGYAIGMFGIKYSKNIFYTSLYLGSAGGGRVDVGGGLIAKITAGINYRHLTLGIGRIKAFSGRLDTTTLCAGVYYNFYK